MKQYSSVISECDYSFDMLYKASYGKSLPPKEKKNLQSLSQEKINTLVLKWAKRAGWKTEEKKGADNILYLSFCP